MRLTSENECALLAILQKESLDNQYRGLNIQIGERIGPWIKQQPDNITLTAEPV